MVALAELKSVAEAAARRGLDPTPVVEVKVEDALGQAGDSMLQVTIVVPGDRFHEIDGSHFLSALLNIQDGVRNAGDDRLTLINYAVPADPTDGDPER